MAKRLDRFSKTLLGWLTKLVGEKRMRPQGTSRSALCPCGSGLKYKRCCLPREQAAKAKKRTMRKPAAK